MVSEVTASESSSHKTVDRIQQQLVDYASNLTYDALPPDVVHAAKLRVIDTLGALIGGFFGEPCRVARNVAAQIRDPHGATVIGTRVKTTADMAAFVNATTARELEFTDFYHWPGSLDGHASDVLTPALAVAEHVRATGREFITAVVLGYEVFLRFCDIFPNGGFDYTNCSCLGSAVAAGKLLKLAPDRLGHCISMAVVPNVILKQVRRDGKTTFKPTATGHAGRAGVFAAMLANAGMEGPHLPFEGKAGWCDHVVRHRFSLDRMGGQGVPFKIPAAQIKIRPSERNTVPLILAAEKLAPLGNIDDVKHISIEAYRKAIDAVGTGEEIWSPDSSDAAYHSIPYVVAAALVDGTVTLRSFDDVHLRDQRLRALMGKISVAENEQFTQAFARTPVEHRARITLTFNNGERRVSEVGGVDDDVSAPADARINEKFRALTEEVLGTKRVSAILDRLWHLEDAASAAAIPGEFVICRGVCRT